MISYSLNYTDFQSKLPSEISKFKTDFESTEYEGCEYEVESFKIIQRTSKVTPKKNGQFVTLWKRDKNQITTPLDSKDGFDFVIIICKLDKEEGYFLFPVEILITHKIITNSKSFVGKRGFRVYPPWDNPQSKQALKTQAWQNLYFKPKLTVSSRDFNSL